MAPGHAVRIPARRDTPAVEPTPEPRTLSTPPAADSPADPNRSGTMRASRLFLLFSAATVLLFLVLVGLLATSPAPGVRNDPFYYGLFGAIGLAIIACAYALTLWPTPRAVGREGNEFVITERTGRVRRLVADPRALRPIVLRRYGAGPLNDGPVVLLEVALPSGTRRSYLVDEGLIDSSAPG